MFETFLAMYLHDDSFTQVIMVTMGISSMVVALEYGSDLLSARASNF